MVFLQNEIEEIICFINYTFIKYEKEKNMKSVCCAVLYFIDKIILHVI